MPIVHDDGGPAPRRPSRCHADPAALRQAFSDLVTGVCEVGNEVELRTGTVAGQSRQHAFSEVSRPDTGTRLVLPVPVFRRDMHPARPA